MSKPSKCPGATCDSQQFEAVAATIGANVVQFVQCVKCGRVVGVIPEDVMPRIAGMIKGQLEQALNPKIQPGSDLQERR